MTLTDCWVFQIYCGPSYEELSFTEDLLRGFWVWEIGTRPSLSPPWPPFMGYLLWSQAPEGCSSPPPPPAPDNSVEGSMETEALEGSERQANGR